LVTRKRLSARLNAGVDFRDSVKILAELGLGGLIFEAIGELGPLKLSQTGRREVRALLRSAEIGLDAIALPMRRSIAEREQWDERLFRMNGAMAMAFEMGVRDVLISPGTVSADDTRKSFYLNHFRQLADMAEHQGVRLICDVGLEPAETMTALIRELGHPAVGLSLAPGRLIATGQNVEQVAASAYDLISIVYATDPEFLGLGVARQGLTVNWTETLSLLEEIEYRGRLTIWPETNIDLKLAISEMGRRLGATPEF